MTKTSKPISGLINIAIDYPHRIALPPSTLPIKLDQGWVGAVNIQHEKGMFVFDKGRTTAETKSKTKLLHRRKTKGEVKIVMADKSVIYTDFDQYGKKFFPKNYTHLEIIFPVNDLRVNIADPKNRDYIEKMAKNFFDKFLISYMFGTGDCAIGLSKKYEWPSSSIIKSYDFTDKDIEELKDDKFNMKLFKFIVKKRKFKPFRGFEKMHGFTSANYLLSDYSNTEKQHCTKEQFKKTFDALSSPYSVDPHFKFIFNAINKSHLKDEYDDAILNLAIAFEVALLHYYSLLVIAFKDPKKEDLTKEFMKELYEKIEKFEETSRIKERIKEFEKLKERADKKLGKKFIKIRESEEYGQWYEIVWKRRHKVAHIGFEGTTKEEVTKGLSLTQKLITYMQIKREDHEKISQIKNTPI